MHDFNRSRMVLQSHLEVSMVLCTQECPPEVREYLEVRTILCAREYRRILFHQAQNAREDSNRPESPKPPKIAITSKIRILVHQAQKAREDSNRPESPKPPKSP